MPIRPKGRTARSDAESTPKAKGKREKVAETPQERSARLQARRDKDRAKYAAAKAAGTLISKRTGKPPKDSPGNPKEIDPDMVRRLAESHAPLDEMAYWLETTPELLSERFGDIIARARAGARISLRRGMWRKALGAKATKATEKDAAQPAVEPSEKMQIYLSQQHLGMREFQRSELTGENGDPIAIETKVGRMTTQQMRDRVVELLSTASRRSRYEEGMPTPNATG